MHPIQSAEEIRQQGGIGLERAAWSGIGQGHGTEAGVIGRDLRGDGGAGNV